MLKLVPNAAIAPTAEDIADRLERLAHAVRGGALGNVTRAVVVLQVDDEGVYVRAYGRPMNGFELVGFMTYATNDLVTANTLDDD